MTTAAPSKLTGTTYIRLATAEVLGGLDMLGISPRNVTVRLWDDGEPCAVDVWFRSYDDAWAYAQLLGLPPVTHFNSQSDDTLVYFGCSSYETERPLMAGARVGVELVASVERPAVGG